ncbi:DUF4062 domain-containing protein [Bradyrhizobium sp. 1]|uniref:DUF4062 domain-containing protein n=1 Tax=Bradyrhizobium sp. 1 TaxID=241591 RepID=UPI001FFB9158|nr:DUF4062 domain-containing protein [Bradyrhizobium sp. 1]MCK1395852.1 DUF4062 domain-containing protein [Bradyrhizobium sp. 1]
MDKVYQVFVSSTFVDLEEERKKVSDTLAKAGFIPSGMELFPATSLKQLEFIKKVIDRCDYYVVIVGARYGSLDGDRSFTEKEYEYALSRNIPVLAFIHKNPGKISAEKTDTDQQQIARLDAFRARLSKSRIVHFWTDINDLCMNVLVAVTSEVTLAPGAGWVRGDQAIDPKLFQELERLRAENEELRKQIAETDPNKLTFSPEFAGPDEDFSFTLGSENPNQPSSPVKCSWKIRYIFIAISELLLTETRETAIGRAIAESYLSYFHKDLPGRESYRISKKDLRTLRFHFEALGLIQAEGRSLPHSLGGTGFLDEYIAWTITEKGRRFIASLWAIKRSEEPQADA